MALLRVTQAVEARLAAAWTRCPVVDPITGTGLPRGGTDHLVVQYPVSRSERMTFGAPGSNIWREEGVVRLVLNLAKGRSLAEALTWADELAGLFRGRTFDGVRFLAPASPAIDDRNDQGNYQQLSVAIPYQADILG